MRNLKCAAGTTFFFFSLFRDTGSLTGNQYTATNTRLSVSRYSHFHRSDVKERITELIGYGEKALK